MSTLKIAQLKRAIEISEQIEILKAELATVLSSVGTDAVGVQSGNGAKPPKFAKLKGKKRGMSPEGRARIAAAQKVRWAKVRKTKRF